MEPILWNADTNAHQTVRINPVTSLLQMVHVLIKSVIPDSKEITALKVTFTKL